MSTAQIRDALTNNLAIGCWYSPSQLIDHEAMIGKNNNYLLEISGTSGAIRFGLHIGGSWVYLTAPTGTIPVNGRGFALAVYDGSKMYLYVANPQVLNQLLTYSQAQTGNLDSSSADLYLAASGYKALLPKSMIWGRALKRPGGAGAIFSTPYSNCSQKRRSNILRIKHSGCLF